MKMLFKIIAITLFVILIDFQLQKANGNEVPEKKLIPGIIVEAIKREIKKFTLIIHKMIDDELQYLKDMKNDILKFAQSTINTTTDDIFLIIDDALDTITKIAEHSIDSGINITECYVNSVDKLNIIRRQLIIEQTECATMQLGEFNKIIDSTVKNFTQDLQIIGALPGRMQDCLTTLNAINCVTDLVTDVANLQIEIPQQVLDAMMEVSNYMISFDQRLHKCQFDELREANDESRRVIDDVKLCVHLTNITTTENYIATIA